MAKIKRGKESQERSKIEGEEQRQQSSERGSKYT